MEKLTDLLIDTLSFVIVAAFVAALLGFPVMWLWNAAMPDVFGLKQIDFGQALCMNILASILFGGSVSSKLKD